MQTGGDVRHKVRCKRLEKLVVVVNLVMEDLERRALATFHTPLCLWRTYVDDTCTTLPYNLVGPFHEYLNSIDPHIQFNVERESGVQLPFLDVLLTMEEDGTISTEVYRKPTHTDQFWPLISTTQQHTREQWSELSCAKQKQSPPVV